MLVRGYGSFFYVDRRYRLGDCCCDLLIATRGFSFPFAARAEQLATLAARHALSTFYQYREVAQVVDLELAAANERLERHVGTVQRISRPFAAASVAVG